MKDETWYEKIGYKENPFMIKPFAFNEELSGYKNEISKVNTMLNAGKLIFIKGDYGLGKTSVLKQIIDEFKGKRKLIYFSANRSEGGIDFETLIKGRAGPIGRLFGIMPKDLILLVDESEKLTMHDSKNIEYFIKNNNLKSVLFVSDTFENVNLTEGLKKKIGNRIIDLSEVLSENQAVNIIKSRLGKNANMVSTKIAKLVFKHANKNPRKMLEYMEDISRYAFGEKCAKRITEDHVRFVLA